MIIIDWLMENEYGTERGVPQLILAGAAVDDVFVIVLFTAFTGLAQGKEMSAMSFINIPASICLGAGLGILTGFLLARFFEKVHLRDTAKVIVLLSLSFMFVTFESKLSGAITFSALIAVMFLGMALQKYRTVTAHRLAVKFNKLWVGAEIMLFVLVGATVDLQHALAAGIPAVLLLAGVLAFRMLGVFLCLLGTKLSWKERIFCALAYMPKATVQAAIGGVPLTMGLACGNMVLAVAVLSIMITAPLGACLIDRTYGGLLTCDGTKKGEGGGMP